MAKVGAYAVARAESLGASGAAAGCARSEVDVRLPQAEEGVGLSPLAGTGAAIPAADGRCSLDAAENGNESESETHGECTGEEGFAADDADLLRCTSALSYSSATLDSASVAGACPGLARQSSARYLLLFASCPPALLVPRCASPVPTYAPRWPQRPPGAETSLPLIILMLSHLDISTTHRHARLRTAYRAVSSTSRVPIFGGFIYASSICLRSHWDDSAHNIINIHVRCTASSMGVPEFGI